MGIYKDISAADFEEGLKNNQEAIVLDVRTDNEYVDGHIPGARLINIMSPDFATQVVKLDKDKAYYVYCRSGARSASACSYMQSVGFRESYNLKSGIIGWSGKLERGR